MQEAKNVVVRWKGSPPLDPGKPAAKMLPAFRIEISNEGDTPVQVVARKWIMRCRAGTRVVEGQGLMNDSPMIAAKSSLSYAAKFDGRDVLSLSGAYFLSGSDGERLYAPMPLCESSEA